MILFAGLMAMFVSCSENEPVVSIKPPTSAELKQIREKALDDIIQTETFNAEDGIDFTSAQGVKLTIYPGNLCVTGEVTLEFVELYERGDMLVVNKPLMGTSEDGMDKGPLITGGQFYVNVTKNGEPIPQCGYFYMTVPVENTGGLNIEMTLWAGKEDEDGNMLWEEGTKGEDVTGREFGVWGQGAEYNVFSGYFGWINIDILYSLPDPKTQIWVKVPQGYDHKNCSVYVVYKDQPGALAYMDVWDPDKQMFTEHYGLAPIGFNFYVIFVSVQKDGKFIYAYKDVIIEENKIIAFETSDLKVLDKKALIDLINSLK